MIQLISPSVRLTSDVEDENPLRLSIELLNHPSSSPRSRCGLVDVLVSGESRIFSSTHYTASAVGARLRYVSHTLTRSGPWQRLQIVQQDATSKLRVTSVLHVHDEAAAVRSTTSITNDGNQPITLLAVTSLVFSSLGWKGHESIDAYTLTRGENAWVAEGRWRHVPLREGIPNLARPGRAFRARNAVRAVSTNSNSTADELPCAFLTHTSGLAWGWQVEHNGAWTWQVHESDDGLHLALLGPTDEEHQWNVTLQPGDTFETVPVSVVLADTGFESAVAAMTQFRRVSRAPHEVADALPVIFNDYMNTLMGDPSTDKLLPLIDAAADAGAEYFCIDAGWYDDSSSWWDAVGEWMPSQRRFPNGIDEVLAHIRDRGMVPGLWLEPESVGLRSPMAVALPEEAFLQRNGIRTAEYGRYHLDFSHPAARAHMDEVVDRLIDGHGVGYFKMDYNIRTGAGTDTRGSAPGHGLLLHNRALLTWLDGIVSRHPDLIIENCASGAMRSDFAMLGRTHLQSTSDQEDATLYAPISAAAPLMILPEQAANWSYPAAEMTDEQIVFTMVNGLAARLYLSGLLHTLTADQRALVADAVAVHKQLRARLNRSVPFWPLGIPRWSDGWVASGLFDAEAGQAVICVWRRPGAADLTTVELSLPDLHHAQWQEIEPAFPHSWDPWSVKLGESSISITADGPDPAARVFRVTAGSRDAR